MANRNRALSAESASPPTRAPSLGGYALAGTALIVVATILAYLPSLKGGFLLDDDGLLYENQLVKVPSGLYRIWFTTEPFDYWPVTNSSFWIEWRLWGMNPSGYHITNLILHIASALFIWAIFRKLSVPGAWLAALLFAVHPVNVESVAWVAQRKNLLAMLFFLLSVLWYLKGPGVYYALSIVAFTLGMLSKGSVVIQPVVLLGLTWWLQRRLSRRDLMRSVPFVVVAIALTAVNVWFQTHGSGEVIRTASLLQRLLGAGAVVWFYLYKALFPIDLMFVYPQWDIRGGQVLWWVPSVAAVGVTITLLWKRNSPWGRPLLFAWGFFCVALLPVMGFADVGFMKHSLVADHYQHIAIIAVAGILAAGWGVWRQRSLANSAAIIAVVILMVRTGHQSGLYADAITLYEATLAKNPTSWLMHNNVGVELAHKGADLASKERSLAAIAHLKEALRLKPDYADAYYNMGLQYDDRPLEAIEWYKKAVSFKPNLPTAENNMANALTRVNRSDEAIVHYQRALRLKPEYPEACYNYGLALMKVGRPQEAIERLQQAIALKPEFPEAENDLGTAMRRTERLGDAMQHYKRALVLKPNYAEAENNLGNVLSQSRRFEEAIEHYRRAVELKPAYPEGHFNLGLTLAKTGRQPQAIEHFRQAAALKPDYQGVYANLAAAYADTNQPELAIVTAEKAIEMARSSGEAELVKKIESWLNSYRAGLSKH